MKLVKRLCPIVTELFLRGGKLNSSLAFLLQSYFKVCKTIRHIIYATNYFIMKIESFV